MTETAAEAPLNSAETVVPNSSASVVPTDSSDRPIPLWPEGVIVVAAAAALLVIGLKHRTWIRRKVTETRAVVEEFQRQGGVEELIQVAKQAAELVKGA